MAKMAYLLYIYTISTPYLHHGLHQARFAVAGIGDESEACPGHTSSPAPTDSGTGCEDQVRCGEQIHISAKYLTID